MLPPVEVALYGVELQLGGVLLLWGQAQLQGHIRLGCAPQQPPFRGFQDGKQPCSSCHRQTQVSLGGGVMRCPPPTPPAPHGRTTPGVLLSQAEGRRFEKLNMGFLGDELNMS